MHDVEKIPYKGAWSGKVARWIPDAVQQGSALDSPSYLYHILVFWRSNQRLQYTNVLTIHRNMSQILPLAPTLKAHAQDNCQCERNRQHCTKRTL